MLPLRPAMSKGGDGEDGRSPKMSPRTGKGISWLSCTGCKCTVSPKGIVAVVVVGSVSCSRKILGNHCFVHCCTEI